VGIVLLAGGVVAKTMTTLASSGALGVQAQQKNQLQSSAGWGILLGGRPEILVSSRAIFDSPILGHGSWAKDMKYTRMLAELENEFGIKASDTLGAKFNYLIPAHSHLTGAWVNAGVLGGIFWIYILISAMKAISVAVRSQLPMKPVYVPLFILFIWDIMFSPIGASRRFVDCYLIVLICDILDPDSPARQMVTQAPARVQAMLHRRNLGRLDSHFKPGL
jgi:O-antigen ligase